MQRFGSVIETEVETTRAQPDKDASSSNNNSNNAESHLVIGVARVVFAGNAQTAGNSAIRAVREQKALATQMRSSSSSSSSSSLAMPSVSTATSMDFPDLVVELEHPLGEISLPLWSSRTLPCS